MVVGALAASPAKPADAAAGFGDVSADTFYAAPVQWMVDNSITSGTSAGCFSPERDVSRGEVAVFLWRLEGKPAASKDSGFDDVDPTAFYAEAIAWMVERNITTGTTATRFEPERDVTRGEAATFLWRYAGRPAGGSEPFTDVDANKFYTDPIAWMARTKITTGTTATTFHPDRPVTRGEIATFLYRYVAPLGVVVTLDGTCGAHFDTLGVGAALPSGAECATRVRPAVEIRAANTTQNHTIGTGPHPTYPRVDGNFTGTTDEILQWVSCKWGIDEDLVRAQAVRESWWNMSATGDMTTDVSRCHPSVRNQSPCPESLGILQVRFPYHADAMDNSIISTAYNADYTYGLWRDCYEGNLTWLNTVDRGSTYGPGDAEGCLGVWFAGRWHTTAADNYIAELAAIVASRTWESGAFIATTGN